jgi:hypothetical protein
MKRFEQISDEDLNKKFINCFLLFYNYYFFILCDENGIFCIQSGREERWPPKFVRHGQVHLAMFSHNVCIFSFQE